MFHRIRNENAIHENAVHEKAVREKPVHEKNVKTRTCFGNKRLPWLKYFSDSFKHAVLSSNV